MGGLDTRIPPTGIVLATGLLMDLVARHTPTVDLEPPVRVLLALLPATAGLLCIAAAVAAFHQARTSYNPMRPGHASRLVTTGIYRLSRNPMYLGLLALLVGWGAWLQAPAAALPVAAYVLYMNRFQIRAEERAMAQRFGAAYAAYRARVRRWL